MPATTSDKNTASQEEREHKGHKPVRQDLRAALKHNAALERLGISEEACRYLGMGHYPAGEKSRSPMAGKLTFQIRDTQLNGDKISSSLLSHVAVAPGKNGTLSEWHFYPGFERDKAVYNADMLLTEKRAIRAARENGFLVLLQDPLDAAKLVSAGNFNVLSTFGASLSHPQIDLIEETGKLLGVKKILVWFHRGEVGAAQDQAVDLLRKRGLSAVGFNWRAIFNDRERGLRTIPDNLTSPLEFIPQQITFVVDKFRQQEKCIQREDVHGVGKEMCR